MASGTANRELLHRGGAFNADVFLVTEADGARHVEKDFSGRAWIVRNTVGRFLIAREAAFLRRLAGTGIVPSGVGRVSPFRLRESFCEGGTLRPHMWFGKTPREKPGDIPREFFEALEAGVREVHGLRIVHLDLHNGRNIMVAPGFRPVLIDWQSALSTAFAAPPLRRALERIDLAGVYKFWENIRPGEIDAGKRGMLRGVMSARRRFWIPALHKTGSSRTTGESKPCS